MTRNMMPIGEYLPNEMFNKNMHRGERRGWGFNKIIGSLILENMNFPICHNILYDSIHNVRMVWFMLSILFIFFNCPSPRYEPKCMCFINVIYSCMC